MAVRKKTSVPAKVKNTNALAKQSINSLMAQDSEVSTGFENMNADDLAIPFITLLQSNSPQVKKGPQKIAGAEEGDIYNTVTQEVFKDTITVVPCAYQKSWVEWVPRNSGGGFVRQHPDSSILDSCEHIVDENGRRDVLPNGNHIVVTAYHYCLLVKDNGDFDRAVISFTSTQLKKSRKWNTQMLNQKIEVKGKKVTPPMFSHTYTLAPVEESNDRGSWIGWEITNPKIIQDPDLYVMARKFHADVSAGEVKTAPPPEEAGVSSDAGANDEEELF